MLLSESDIERTRAPGESVPREEAPTGVEHGDRILVFYDGACAACHLTVRFLLARSGGDSQFGFAPIGGTTFAAAIPAETRTHLPDSILVVDPSGALLTRSEAILYAVGTLPGAWGSLAHAFERVPRQFLDVLYIGFASIRRRLLPSPKDVCPVGSPELCRSLLP